jgi:hypothetical protein
LSNGISKRREELSEDAESWLHGEECGFFRFKRKEELAELWREHGDRIVAEHVDQWPGTRPLRWWQYDALRIAVGTYPGCFWDGKLAEPRKRLGGVGTPSHECLGYVPHFSYGLPAAWISQWDVEYYTGTARDLGTFKGVAIDPNDPPNFESQASYLERNGVMIACERKRLTKEDFEPEAVVL